MQRQQAGEISGHMQTLLLCANKALLYVIQTDTRQTSSELQSLYLFCLPLPRIHQYIC